jgi:hypothetical protein
VTATEKLRRWFRIWRRKRQVKRLKPWIRIALALRGAPALCAWEEDLYANYLCLTAPCRPWSMGELVKILAHWRARVSFVAFGYVLDLAQQSGIGPLEVIDQIAKKQAARLRPAEISYR